MSLTFLQKAEPSSEHGPLGTLQLSRLSTDWRGSAHDCRSPVCPT